MEKSTSGGQPKRNVRKKGQLRRQQIIDVARKILIEAGINGLVLRDVAERLNITHGNLQYYFATKDDLLVAIFDYELSKYTDTLKTAIEQTSTKEGRISMIIDSGVSELKSESTRLWRMLFSLVDQNPQLADILRKENERYDAVLTDVLGSIAPGMSKQRRSHIAQMIRMILDGLGIQLAYSDPNSAKMLALQSEIKAATAVWLSEPTK